MTRNLCVVLLLYRVYLVNAILSVLYITSMLMPVVIFSIVLAIRFHKQSNEKDTMSRTAADLKSLRNKFSLIAAFDLVGSVGSMNTHVGRIGGKAALKFWYH